MLLHNPAYRFSERVTLSRPWSAFGEIHQQSRFSMSVRKEGRKELITKVTTGQAITRRIWRVWGHSTHLKGSQQCLLTRIRFDRNDILRLREVVFQSMGAKCARSTTSQIAKKIKCQGRLPSADVTSYMSRRTKLTISQLRIWIGGGTPQRCKISSWFSELPRPILLGGSSNESRALEFLADTKILKIVRRDRIEK